MRKISEEITRKEMIDPQLERAGRFLRNHSKVNEGEYRNPRGMGKYWRWWKPFSRDKRLMVPV